MCPASVKRLTFAAHVDENSIMACTAKQLTERRRWNIKSNAESRRKAYEKRQNREVLTEENEGKGMDWWKRWGTNLWNEAREKEKAWEEKFRECKLEEIDRKRLGCKRKRQKGDRRAEEQWRRHVTLPFLAEQVHASILAMPGGKCLVQSRSEIATFRRTRSLRSRPRLSCSFWPPLIPL